MNEGKGGGSPPAGVEMDVNEREGAGGHKGGGSPSSGVETDPNEGEPLLL
jgi:hypothetical protein